ncbi:MAG: 50S ribosomal protein L16 [bacterium]|nr:50S ribosomal protein L16 [bacterium]
MPRMPKRVKFRKEFRRASRVSDRKATKGNYVAYGEFGLQALEPCWLTARQLEAGRIAAQHFLKRQGKVYIRVFPDKPVSKKPLEQRMGKGKADTDYWAARVKPGTMLFEIAGVPEEVARGTLVRIARKMPVRCRFVGRRLAV